MQFDARQDDWLFRVRGSSAFRQRRLEGCRDRKSDESMSDDLMDRDRNFTIDHVVGHFDVDRPLVPQAGFDAAQISPAAVCSSSSIVLATVTSS